MAKTPAAIKMQARTIASAPALQSGGAIPPAAAEAIRGLCELVGELADLVQGLKGNPRR